MNDERKIALEAHNTHKNSHATQSAMQDGIQTAPEQVKTEPMDDIEAAKRPEKAEVELQEIDRLELLRRNHGVSKQHSPLPITDRIS